MQVSDKAFTAVREDIPKRMPEKRLHHSAIEKAYGLGSMRFNPSLFFGDKLSVAGSNPAERGFRESGAALRQVDWILDASQASPRMSCESTRSKRLFGKGRWDHVRSVRRNAGPALSGTGYRVARKQARSSLSVCFLTALKALAAGLAGTAVFLPVRLKIYGRY